MAVCAPGMAPALGPDLSTILEAFKSLCIYLL